MLSALSCSRFGCNRADPRADTLHGVDASEKDGLIPQWAFVGNGRGNFELNERYAHVGNGSGSWRRDVVTTQEGRTIRPLCKVLLVVLVSCAIGVSIGLAVRGAPSAWNHLLAWREQLRTSLRTPTSTNPDRPQALPSTAQPSQQPAPSTTPKPSMRQTSTTSVLATLAPPVQSAAPKHPQTGTTIDRFDCKGSASEWRSMWSQAKKNYCCTHAPPQGCQQEDATPKFDCDIGPPALWITEKRSYCCKEKGRGCLPGDDDRKTGFDCDEIPAGGKDEWVAEKKAFCRHSSTKSSEKVDCVGDVGSWSKHQRVWCCAVKHEGCPASYRPAESEEKHGIPLEGAGNVNESYDCRENLRQWVTAWEPGKKAWCCRHKHVACPPVPDADMLGGGNG